jgi:hypothetical protein
MWLDAFIKPNSADMQKARVSGVSGVSSPRKPNEYKGLAVMTQTDTGIKPKCQSVSVVSEQIDISSRLTRLTPTDTGAKPAYQDSETPRKPNEYKGLANQLTRLTRLTPQKHNAQEITENSKVILEQFRFDLVQQEIDAGHPADELHRVNNIAWRLMTGRGFSFNEAINEAAKWVVHNPAHRDEAAFVDVMKLFKGVVQ